MNYKEKYRQWLTFADPDTKAELESLTDEKEIEDRFYKDLAFGTGGLRGIMGAGSNRMNRYTVGKATLGLANYLKSTGKADLKVAIAYDSRNNSADGGGHFCKLRLAGVSVRPAGAGAGAVFYHPVFAL